MTQKLNPVARIPELPLERVGHGKAYDSLDVRFSHLIGLTQLGAAYTEVAPGKSACPFHNHHVEDEMFVILEGEGTYRFGPDSYVVKAGDVLGAPRGGEEVAHKLTNTGSGLLKYLSISTMADTEICQYPDSGKFEASTRAPGSRKSRFVATNRTEANLDYWDGEDSAD
ncbi:MAG: cupin domain-containing protein [Hyphomonas sp.]